jgi:hypothetical protein
MASFLILLVRILSVRAQHIHFLPMGSGSQNAHLATHAAHLLCFVLIWVGTRYLPFFFFGRRIQQFDGQFIYCSIDGNFLSLPEKNRNGLWKKCIYQQQEVMKKKKPTFFRNK